MRLAFRLALGGLVLGAVAWGVAVWLACEYYEDAALAFNLCSLAGAGLFAASLVAALIGTIQVRQERRRDE